MSDFDSSPQSNLPDEWPEASVGELVTMCTSPALVGLGILPTPGKDQPSLDLPLARHFIDLLALLNEKTGDRLDAIDQQAIDQSLHELRMAFVQVQQSSRLETEPASADTERDDDVGEDHEPGTSPDADDDPVTDSDEGE